MPKYDESDPQKLPPPLPFPPIPDGYQVEGGKAGGGSLPLPFLPVMAEQAGGVGGVGGRDVRDKADSGSDRNGQEILLALSGLQSSANRIEQILREALT